MKLLLLSIGIPIIFICCTANKDQTLQVEALSINARVAWQHSLMVLLC